MTQEPKRKFQCSNSILVWGVVAIFMGACITLGTRLVQYAIPSPPYSGSTTIYHKVLPTEKKLKEAISRFEGRTDEGIR